MGRQNPHHLKKQNIIPLLLEELREMEEDIVHPHQKFDRTLSMLIGSKPFAL